MQPADKGKAVACPTRTHSENINHGGRRVRHLAKCSKEVHAHATLCLPAHSISTVTNRQTKLQKKGRQGGRSQRPVQMLWETTEPDDQL